MYLSSHGVMLELMEVHVGPNTADVLCASGALIQCMHISIRARRIAENGSEADGNLGVRLLGREHCNEEVTVLVKVSLGDGLSDGGVRRR